MRFQLKMMMMHGNTAVMTLKHGAQESKVAALCDALQFVATMEQHRMALISGTGTTPNFLLDYAKVRVSRGKLTKVPGDYSLDTVHI